MKNYIIIDLWNGEGYSDSNAKIKQFKDDSEALAYCKGLAVIQAKSFGTTEFEKENDSGYYYESKNECEDSGGYFFEEIKEDIKGVILFPNVIEYKIYTQSELENWDWLINCVITKNSDKDIRAEFTEQDYSSVVHEQFGEFDHLFIELDHKEKETTYFIFGMEATETLINKGFDELISFCEDSGDFEVFKFIEGETKPIELLESLKGWADYAIINKEEYIKLIEL